MIIENKTYIYVLELSLIMVKYLLTLLSPAATIILMFSKVPHLNMSGAELAESYSLGTLVLLDSKLFESPKLLISLPCDILT